MVNDNTATITGTVNGADIATPVSKKGLKKEKPKESTKNTFTQKKAKVDTSSSEGVVSGGARKYETNKAALPWDNGSEKDSTTPPTPDDTINMKVNLGASGSKDSVAVEISEEPASNAVPEHEAAPASGMGVKRAKSNSPPDAEIAVKKPKLDASSVEGYDDDDHLAKKSEAPLSRSTAGAQPVKKAKIRRVYSGFITDSDEE